MNTIIVATDYSPSAEAAFNYAVLLARASHADIALINSYRFDIHALNGCIPPAAMDGMVEENEQRLRQYAEKLSQQYRVKVKSYTSTLSVEETLTKYMRDLNADLVVMGTRRYPNGDVAPANTARTVIEHAYYPVLVVPEGSEMNLPARFLYACDYKALPDQSLLYKLNNIIAAVSGELKIVNVETEQSHEPIFQGAHGVVYGQLEAAVQNLVHVYSTISAADFNEGIAEAIITFQPDVLIMAPHKYGFWKSLFHKSATKELVRKSKLPVLVFRA